MGDYESARIPATLKVTVTGDATGNAEKDVKLHLARGGKVPEDAVYIQVNALSLGGVFAIRSGGFTIRGMNYEGEALPDEMRATGNIIPLIDLDGDGRAEDFHIEPGGAGVINHWSPGAIELAFSFPAVVQVREEGVDGGGRAVSNVRELHVRVEANLAASWSGFPIGRADETAASSELDQIPTDDKPGHGVLEGNFPGTQGGKIGLRVTRLPGKPFKLDMALADEAHADNAGLVLVFPGPERTPPAGIYAVEEMAPVPERLELKLRYLGESAEVPEEGSGHVRVDREGSLLRGNLVLSLMRLKGSFGITL